jgi:hypothetical protein
MSAISLPSLASLSPTLASPSSTLASSSDPSSTTKGELKSYFKERNADVVQLQKALQSGDLAGAQQDYSKIVALGNNVLNKDNPYLRSDRGMDFDAIGGALQNGNMAGAQQAFAALQSTYGNPPAGSPSSAADTAAPSGSGLAVIA